MPAWPAQNKPANAVNQTLRSLTNETHRKPIRNISIAAGTAGNGFTALLGPLVKPTGLAGGCRNSAPILVNCALTGLTISIVPEIVVGESAGHTAAKTVLWCVTVGEALATEVTNSKDTMHNR